jgi:hypothetical protein
MEAVVENLPAVVDWNEARMTQLETLYHEGLPFSVIADEIGVTRNAAIGKARRMNLPPRREPPPPPEEKKKVEPRSPRRRTFALAGRPPPPPPRPPRPERKPEPAPDPAKDHRCSIYRLDDSTCRYPLWSMHARHHERLYCGVPSASMSASIPYCRRHSVLCNTKKNENGWPQNSPRSSAR